jgi:hypothetical protein
LRFCCFERLLYNHRGVPIFALVPALRLSPTRTFSALAALIGLYNSRAIDRKHLEWLAAGACDAAAHIGEILPVALNARWIAMWPVRPSVHHFVPLVTALLYLAEPDHAERK